MPFFQAPLPLAENKLDVTVLPVFSNTEVCLPCFLADPKESEDGIYSVCPVRQRLRLTMVRVGFSGEFQCATCERLRRGDLQYSFGPPTVARGDTPGLLQGTFFVLDQLFVFFQG